MLEDADDALLAEIEPVLTLGIHHEQQHQELLVTDIKHVFCAESALSSLSAKRSESETSEGRGSQHFVEFDEATALIGHEGDGLFLRQRRTAASRARSRVFALASRLVTNGEYLAFMEAGGYARSEFWLSLGWTTVNEQRWQAPLYWEKRDGAGGISPSPAFDRSMNPNRSRTSAISRPTLTRIGTARVFRRSSNGNAPRPVCRSKETSSTSERFHPAPAVAASDASALAPNVRRRLGMDAQRLSPLPRLSRRSRRARRIQRQVHVQPDGPARRFLRDLAQSHIRPTYRNFFQPEKRWQFTGIRLARDLA